MVKIMLDSASDCQNVIPCDHYIPITVDLDGRSYKDGIDLDANTFYQLLPQCKEFPKTAQPSPEDYLKVFEQVKQSGDELVYLCISSTLSGTYQSANIAREIADYDAIYIVDTRSATHMIGMLAQYASQLAAQGMTGAAIAEMVVALRQRQAIYAGLDTLEYLSKGGRLSKASAAVGSVANIKPIVTINDDGKVESFAKSIGVKRAVATIARQVQVLQVDTNFPIWSLYTEGVENCSALEEALAECGILVTGRLQVGPTIGAHIGPGAYGITFVKK